eukprot:1623238-Prymnesium_polylepis.1
MLPLPHHSSPRDGALTQKHPRQSAGPFCASTCLTCPTAHTLGAARARLRRAPRSRAPSAADRPQSRSG